MSNIQDGSATFKIIDIREESFKKAMVDLVYPVGIVVPVASNVKPDFMKYGTWEKIGSGRTLWGADSSHTAGTTIEAGLPNITGEASIGRRPEDGNYAWSITKESGAIINSEVAEGISEASGVATGGKSGIGIDASRSNPIYGKSSTVQPPAYVVNFWKRTE